MSEVDVIIPTFDKPIYIAETLQSIESQPFVKNIIIVLDRVDKAYFAKIKINKKVTKVFNSKIPGIVSALNLGLKISQADFVARIDSDDIMLPGRIESQLNFLNSNPDHVCVGSNLEIFGEGRKIKVKRYPSKHEKIIEHLTYQNAIAHPAVMYRRKSVIEAGCYRRIFEGAEDYDLWLRLSRIGKLYNLNEPLTKYRISSDQYSSKFSAYRSDLDSLVRLVNLGSIRDTPKNFFDSPATIDQVRKYLEIYSKKVGLNQPEILHQVVCAQRFGHILEIKQSRIKPLLKNFKVLVLFCKLILFSPIFSLRVVTRKFFR